MISGTRPKAFKLRESARRPEELLLHERGLKIAAHYYIFKGILPALNRILEPIGVDVFRWHTPPGSARARSAQPRA